jgi:predicted DNA-binding transcriptional regulator AlpA
MNKNQNEFTEKEMSEILNLARNTIRTHIKKNPEYIVDGTFPRKIKKSFIDYAKKNMNTKNGEEYTLPEIREILNLKECREKYNKKFLLYYIDFVPQKYKTFKGKIWFFKKGSVEYFEKAIKNNRFNLAKINHEKTLAYAKKYPQKKTESELAYFKRISKHSVYSLTTIYRIMRKNNHKEKIC